MGTEGYLEYTKENEKGKVNQLDVENKKDKHNYKTRTCVIQSQNTTDCSREPKQQQANGTEEMEITVYQGQVYKTARTKLDDQYKVH